MIEIKKVVNIVVEIDDKTLEVEQEYVMQTSDGKCLIGKFITVTKHSALEFEGAFGEKFAVMPKSIVQIAKAGLTVAV